MAKTVNGVIAFFTFQSLTFPAHVGRGFPSICTWVTNSEPRGFSIGTPVLRPDCDLELELDPRQSEQLQSVVLVLLPLLLQLLQTLQEQHEHPLEHVLLVLVALQVSVFCFRLHVFFCGAWTLEMLLLLVLLLLFEELVDSFFRLALFFLLLQCFGLGLCLDLSFGFAAPAKRSPWPLFGFASAVCVVLLSFSACLRCLGLGGSAIEVEVRSGCAVIAWMRWCTICFHLCRI